MKKYTMPQGSPEWFAVRAGIPTASEFDALITPLWKPRTGEGVNTYLSRKLAERWLGMPLAGFGGSWAMEQGKLREEEAIPYFAFERACEVEPIGFITTDNGAAGCSPDGMLGGGVGIECKCPDPHTHAAYLLAADLPSEYAAQVHGSMWVTGAKCWHFMSYARRFPAFMLEVKRDERIIEAIAGAVESFNAKLAKAYARLVEINGGPPIRPEGSAMDRMAMALAGER